MDAAAATASRPGLAGDLGAAHRGRRRAIAKPRQRAGYGERGVRASGARARPRREQRRRRLGRAKRDRTAVARRRSASVLGPTERLAVGGLSLAVLSAYRIDDTMPSRDGDRA